MSNWQMIISLGLILAISLAAAGWLGLRTNAANAVTEVFARPLEAAFDWLYRFFDEPVLQKPNRAR